MATLILDQFTDTDGVSLSSHTIGPTNTPATSWTVLQGTADINANHARKTSIGTNLYARVDAGQADVTVQVDAHPFDSAGQYAWDVIGRVQDVDNLWLLEVYTGDNTVRIYEKISGSYTSRASASLTLTADTTHTIKLVFSGTSIQGWVDGVQYVSFTSSSYQSQTKHGIRIAGAEGGWVDNFQVDENGGGGGGGGGFPTQPILMAYFRGRDLPDVVQRAAL